MYAVLVYAAHAQLHALTDVKYKIIQLYICWCTQHVNLKATRRHQCTHVRAYRALMYLQVNEGDRKHIQCNHVTLA